MPDRNLWGMLVPAAAVFTFFSFLIHEIYSLDIWWQVAIGREILDNFAVPFIDRFTIAANGRPYHDSHWLFQVVVAVADRVGGMVGVQAVMIAVWSAVALLAYRAAARWTAGSTTAAILTFLAMMASVERFLPRPEIVTFLGIAAFYYLLQRGRYVTVRQLALLAVIQVTWANSHGLFVIGPFMAGCYLAVEAGRRIRKQDNTLAAAARATVVLSAATLATPFGWNGWRYALVLFREAGGAGIEVIGTLGELSSTFGEASRGSQAFWVYALLLAAVVAAGAAGAVRGRLSARYIVVLAMMVASLFGRRNIALFAVVAGPFIAEHMEPLPGRFRRSRWFQVITALVIACWALFPLSGRYFTTMELAARSGIGVTPSFFPHGLSRALEELEFQGPVLNSNALGGFYLYHGYPDRVPLTDGRWEVYDPDELVTILRESRNGDAWRGLVSRYGIAGLLLGHSTPEAKAILPSISTDPAWKLSYLDRAASFWIKVPRSGHPEPGSSVSLDRLPQIGRVEDGLMLNDYFSGVGAHGAQIANLERMLRFTARRALVLRLLGDKQIEIGDLEEARKSFEQLITLDSQSDHAMNQLAFFAFRRGDYADAADWMRRAINIMPGNSNYLENYQRIQEALEAAGDPVQGGKLDSR